MSEHPPNSTPGQGPGPLPEPSFQHLVETFAVPALIWTGYLKNPADEEAEPNLELAKYQIGLLEVLEDRTKGNLTTAEQEYLEGMLHNVRMAYVRASDETPRQTAPEPDRKAEPEPEPTAEPEQPDGDEGDDDRPGLRETKKYDI